MNTYQSEKQKHRNLTQAPRGQIQNATRIKEDTLNNKDKKREQFSRIAVIEYIKGTVTVTVWIVICRVK